MNDLYEKAKGQTREYANKSEKVLIEVSAQHPLIEGMYPNEEFLRRLNMAVNIFHHPVYSILNDCIDKNKMYIFVPGSRHRYEDGEDKISLAEAGVTWLRDNISCYYHDRMIGGDNVNDYLTNGRGIYNSEDECKATVALFEELDVGRLICICSQG